ncbi:MAG TPA: response regulator [Methylomirabilota bacterium]|jgi:CheY-like chemotaxis protein|nr:response regulator [Methylomirabilota bacterium]
MSNPDKAADLTGLHVLVVDDDQDSLDAMQIALQFSGALVTTAPSAKKAFATLSRLTPDVIVCDLKMPEEDGPSFVRELRRLPPLRSTPVLAVTAYDYLYIQHELHAAGFTGFIRKPISFPDLVRAVAALARAGKSAG